MELRQIKWQKIEGLNYKCAEQIAMQSQHQSKHWKNGAVGQNGHYVTCST